MNLERPLHELLGDVMRETLDVDGRAARTLWTLFRYPGMLTAEFLAGRRQRYSPPLRLYLVISLIFFVVASWAARSGALLDDGQAVAIEGAVQAQFLANELPHLMFVLLPVFALLLKLVFRGQVYFGHLIHALHLHCAAFVVLALILPLEGASNPLLIAAQLVIFGYLLTGFVISVRRVYDASWIEAIAKSGLVFMLYVATIAGAFHLLRTVLGG